MSGIFKNITIILLLPVLTLISLLSASTLKTDVQSQTQSEVAVSNPDLSKFEEVFPGHNKVQADRVNLVFGFEKQFYEGKIKEAKQNLRDSLYWDGEPKTVFYENDDDQPDYLTYDLFAIEPLRSMKDKFNLWFYEKEFENGGLLEVGDFRGDAVQFRNSLPIYIQGGYKNELKASHAFLLSNILLDQDYLQSHKNSYSTKILPEMVEILEDKSKLTILGEIELFLDFTQPLLPEDEYTLTHELGHALFDFSDEYSTSIHEVQNDFKINCANTKEEAQRKWGDLIGQYDPFMDKIADDYKRIIGEDPREDYEDPFNGEPIESTYLDDGRVGIAEEKCGGKGFAPTFSSIMSNGENYWNPVQRRQIETIMATFSGEELTANNQSSSSVSSSLVEPSSVSSTSSSSSISSESSSVSIASNQNQETDNSATSFTSGVEQSSSSSSSQSVSTSGKIRSTPRTGAFNPFSSQTYLSLLLGSLLFWIIGSISTKLHSINS